MKNIRILKIAGAMFWSFALIQLLGADITLSAERPSPRRVISLDGTWDIAQGSMDSVPQEFERKVPVPGLVDMAEPAFEEVGKKSEKRQAFWYRRTFAVKGRIPGVAILKIYKAKYGTKVWLNGQIVGEHLPCFTPALLDVKEFLKPSGQQNELIVRVGADRESRPINVPSGWDFEKYLYIPGIYDSVELILTGKPYIVNVQTVPDIAANQVRIITEIQGAQRPRQTSVTYEVTEVSTGRLVGAVKSSRMAFSVDETNRLDVAVPIKDCKLWTPENPFLYELRVSTGPDMLQTRFGMRSFRFDKDSGRAILNGKPYFMRGTNVCAYRFFEDAERGDKPWREEWVRRLHRKFKGMNWNSIRYCIGFPPEKWYDIADEEGFLIQDEFPIWLLSKAPENPESEKIIPEYTEWMRERWNHPCVVIWDAQNESVTDQTGKALQAVRDLDFSKRPWDNGWAEPQSENDCVEAHPYLFSRIEWGRGEFRLSDLAKTSGIPNLRDLQKKYKVPIIINEYAWLWLNRDGTTTCLTGKVYGSLLGPDSTIAQRRLLYARYLAALTEFWRAHRECAGVLHFCGLGYSRAGDKPRPEGGATSDHFIDLEKLTFEPNFEQYVSDAFSPVGLMIDFWGEQLTAGDLQKFDIVILNDLYNDWAGVVRLYIVRDGRVIAEKSNNCTVAGLGREILSFSLTAPEEVGKYQLIAELVGENNRVIRSLRDVKVARP